MAAWLQECPHCGYVAEDLEQGDASSKPFVEGGEFKRLRSAAFVSDVARRCWLGAAIAADRQEVELAFQRMLWVAWVADDRQDALEANRARIAAVTYLSQATELSVDTRLVSLDVLRRASRWQQAGELAMQLRSEGGDLATVVSFQQKLIQAKDDRAHSIGEAFEQAPPDPSFVASDSGSSPLRNAIRKLTEHRYNKDGSYKER